MIKIDCLYIPTAVLSANIPYTEKLIYALLFSYQAKGYELTKKEVAKILKMNVNSIYGNYETLKENGFIDFNKGDVELFVYGSKIGVAYELVYKLPKDALIFWFKLNTCENTKDVCNLFYSLDYRAVKRFIRKYKELGLL